MESKIFPKILSPLELKPEPEITHFATQLKAPRFVASLLHARKIEDLESARNYFLPDPKAYESQPPMKDMQEAVTLLLGARERGEKVCVHGDYDVDGVTATALLVQCLHRLGFITDWFLPSRFKEGYGLTRGGMERIAAGGSKWVVSVDTGITAVTEVEVARSLGMKVIITDHHQAPEILPQAEAILNPNRPGCPYPNKGLSGVGVAYRLAQALSQALEGPDFEEALAFVALGSLADNAPLNPENRAIIRCGMRQIASPKNLGLRVLLREAGIDPSDFSSMDLLFKVTPLLNAAGRLGSPEQSLKLFLAGTEIEAHECIRQLREVNQKRRELDTTITEAAISQIEKDPNLRKAACLTVASKDWHEGVIGIVAARLVERYRRPAFVLSIDDQGFAKASGRTVAGFHLHKAHF